MKNNDSPLPVFETDEHNQYFLATIKIHEAFVDEDTYLKRIGKEREDKEGNVHEKEHEKVHDNVHDNVHEDVHEDVHDNINSKLTERQQSILSLIKSNDSITLAQMSTIVGVSKKTIQRDIALLNEIVKRIGGEKSGHWEITQ